MKKFILFIFLFCVLQSKAFRQADLDRVFLRREHCQRCDFSKANLRGRSLQSFDLTGSNFEEAIVENVNFSGAHLDETNFRKAHARGATMNSALISNANFTEADLANVNFNNSIMRGTRFQQANLTGAHFVYADLTRAQFQHIRNLLGATIDGAIFSGATIRYTNFSGARGQPARLETNVMEFPAKTCCTILPNGTIHSNIDYCSWEERQSCHKKP